MPYVVSEVQPTPNPNAVKFLLDRVVSDVPASFFTKESAQGHAVAERLFAIPGVSSLLLLGDFITVNKVPDAKWSALTAKVKKVLASLSEEARSSS